MTFVKTFSMMERQRPAMISSGFFPFLCSVTMLLFMKTVQRLPRTAGFFEEKAAFFHGPVLERSGADFILKRKGEFFSWPGREVWPFFISRKRRLANGR